MNHNVTRSSHFYDDKVGWTTRFPSPSFSLYIPTCPSPPDKDIEEKTLATLSSAQKKIKLEIHDLSERVKVSKELIQKLKEQIEQAEEENG